MDRLVDHGVGPVFKCVERVPISSFLFGLLFGSCRRSQPVQIKTSSSHADPHDVNPCGKLRCSEREGPPGLLPAGGRDRNHTCCVCSIECDLQRAAVTCAGDPGRRAGKLRSFALGRNIQSILHPRFDPPRSRHRHHSPW